MDVTALYLNTIKQSLKGLCKSCVSVVCIKLQIIILLLALAPTITLYGQSYTSYFTGNATDVVTSPQGGICLMGGATEDDEAMKWFLRRADGGDVLVLRASGSDGYNEYLYTELGISVNSVETIRFDYASSSSESYIHERIEKAEAIWFAGGDQWKYVSFWRNTPIDSLINEGLTNRNIVIGGTSAGMAIQGGFYFSAQNGTVTSAEALQDPYNSMMTVQSDPFLSNPILSDVITDTHYDDPDRKGRHTTFLARALTDMNIPLKGIACDEYTAVCIGTDGIAQVFGQYPDYDDNAYFIQPNCELEDNKPEVCIPGSPLTWNHNNAAVKVYKVKGTFSGAHTFDLNDWKSGDGGTWENWWVDNGVFFEESSSSPNCMPTSTQDERLIQGALIVPNPATSYFRIEADIEILSPYSLDIFDLHGRQVIDIQCQTRLHENLIDISSLKNGIYNLRVRTNNLVISEILTVLK